MGIARPGVVKLHAQRNEPPDSSRGLFSQNARCAGVAQTRARRQGILQVEFRAIIGSQSHRESPLSITSIALAKLAFGKKRHPQMIWQTQGNGKAGYSTANDYHVVVLAVSHVFSPRLSVFFYTKSIAKKEKVFTLH